MERETESRDEDQGEDFKSVHSEGPSQSKTYWEADEYARMIEKINAKGDDVLYDRKSVPFVAANTVPQSVEVCELTRDQLVTVLARVDTSREACRLVIAHIHGRNKAEMVRKLGINKVDIKAGERVKIAEKSSANKEITKAIDLDTDVEEIAEATYLLMIRISQESDYDRLHDKYVEQEGLRDKVDGIYPGIPYYLPLSKVLYQNSKALFARGSENMQFAIHYFLTEKDNPTPFVRKMDILAMTYLRCHGISTVNLLRQVAQALGVSLIQALLAVALTNCKKFFTDLLRYFSEEDDEASKYLGVLSNMYHYDLGVKAGGHMTILMIKVLQKSRFREGLENMVRPDIDPESDFFLGLWADEIWEEALSVGKGNNTAAYSRARARMTEEKRNREEYMRHNYEKRPDNEDESETDSDEEEEKQ